MQPANPAKQKVKETAKSARVDKGARKRTGGTSARLFHNLQSVKNRGLKDPGEEQCDDAHN